MSLVARRAVLRAGTAMGASLFLPQARACEFFSSTLRILHPWARASAPGADAATISMVFDEVLVSDRLVGASTPVAEGAEMGGAGARPHVDFSITAGEVARLSELGTHLRLVGLRHPLELGRAYPLVLVFERGGTVQADFDIDYA